MNKLKEYISDSKIELNKVIFPTADEIRKAFIAVVIVVTVVALFLALVDVIMSSTLSSII
ncbi:preprotein translocase subunit SecE [Campylobacter corcagiensis]|uniref:Protein translocase subunit SecE n=1 Tax=Campylobacter corcagiensis TaxID=1448857 RepID=A0A7M1LG44_9BACT|nr:preprotein translocase subunit SecE [Campylobacter corcagiensis]QKF64272.1 preprotein translocase SecYEG, SecE subunit [Campylobacter corcagiensis]QOQ87538.1 preprotein translocase subunit SecE [Campylobacter corcagiensis]